MSARSVLTNWASFLGEWLAAHLIMINWFEVPAKRQPKEREWWQQAHKMHTKNHIVAALSWLRRWRKPATTGATSNTIYLNLMTLQITNGQKYFERYDNLSHKLTFRMRLERKMGTFMMHAKWVDNSTNGEILAQRWRSHICASF